MKCNICGKNPAEIFFSKEENGVKQMCVADWRGISWVGIDEFSTHGVTHMVFVNEK